MEPTSSSESSHCAYCGRTILSGRACAAHAELAQLDAAAHGGGPPLSEKQHGLRPPYRIPKRGGRHELY